MRIQQFNNYETDLLQVILWQYNEATNLLALLNDKQAWYNQYQSQFWLDWYNNVFNLSSTQLNLFGATVWSIILNVPLFVLNNNENPDAIFGFNAYNPSFPTLENSTNWNFYGPDGYSDIGANFLQTPLIKITLAEQQFLLRLRYFQLTNLGDIVDINEFLRYLLLNSSIDYPANETIYMIDNYGMSITYHFTSPDFPLNLFNAITLTDLWPRPAGVAITFSGL